MYSVNDFFAALFIGSFIVLATLIYHYGIEWEEEEQ
jgi:hypothetical protein